MAAAKPLYEDLVFINCPFDASYYPMLRAIIFTIYRCGFSPISALSYDNGLVNRLAKIQDCIGSAKYGIHDISNIKLSSAKYPRFNMPFELGLFFGAQKYGGEKHLEKNAVIFDKTRFRYQKFISDLNGVDIKAHKDQPNQVVRELRNWFSLVSGKSNLPGDVEIIKEYKDVKLILPLSAKKLGFKPDNIPYKDYCNLVEEAIKLIQKFKKI